MSEKDEFKDLCLICGFPLEKETRGVTKEREETDYYSHSYRSEIDRIIDINRIPTTRRVFYTDYENVTVCPRCDSKNFMRRKPEDISDSTEFVNKNQYNLVGTKYYCTVCKKEVSHSAVKIIFPSGKFAFIDMLYCPQCETRPEPIKKV